MTRTTRVKLAPKKRPGRAASVLTTVIAFGLICVGIVLLSRPIQPDNGTTDTSEHGEVADADRAIRSALSALDEAQSALLASDYSEARALLGRARQELQPLASKPMSPNP